MKSHFTTSFLTLLTLLFFTLALAEPAPLPLGFSRQNSPQPQQQQQQPLRPNPQPLQSSNSFDSSSTTSSSTSSSDTKKKFSLSSIFGSSSAPFRCQRTPTTPVLHTLQVFLQDLITRHRDDLSPSSSEPFFRVCLGGHEEDTVKPSVVFKDMAKKQVEKLERILRSQVLVKFPNLVVKRTGGGGLALVQEDEGRVMRRESW